MDRVRLVYQNASDVAARWKRQYGGDGKYWGRVNGRDAAEVYSKLLALPESATRGDVAAIIGNESWMGERCSFCGEYDSPHVRIGDERDYESDTVDSCRACAVKVAEALLDLVRGE